MITQNNAAQAADTTPFSDEYVNAVIQQHGYDSPECVIARLHQWIGLHGGENGVTLLMYEAHKALVKLRTPVADERAAVDPCGYVAVKVSAVDWLKKHFPALTIRAGLCERFAGRLYTITRLMSDHDAALASAPVKDLAAAIHWPACWDAAAYPTVDSALAALAASFQCSNQDTHQAPDIDLDSLTEPSALSALADGLESIAGNENAALAAAYIRQQAEREASAPVAGEAPPTDWQNALRIAELPEVDEALAVFCNDGTLDNAVGLVQAILDAAPQASTVDGLPVWWERFMNELTLRSEDEVRNDLAGILEICALDAIASAAPQASDAVQGTEHMAPGLGDVVLPRLPPITHKWAALISDSMARALENWARAYTRTAILADRQQRARNADEYEKMRDVLQWIVDDAASGGMAKLRPQQEKRARAALSAQPAQKEQNDE